MLEWNVFFEDYPYFDRPIDRETALQWVENNLLNKVFNGKQYKQVAVNIYRYEPLYREPETVTIKKVV